MTDEAERLGAALQGRYRVERELGRGGMATVYLSEDLKHERRVAVKVLHTDLAAVLGAERFLREVKITARLDHPHILPLLDSGEAGDFLYYVMPFVEGESLRDRLDREGQLPLEDAVRITCEVADALGYAHSHDVVHRDIKPENILLSGGHARVADFGIARAITAAGGQTLTQTGMAIGTPAYMSPEQGTGVDRVDGRSDIYSLGCVLYEMLAGEPPFTGPTVESIVHQHLTADPPPITAIRPAVPAGVARTLARSIAKTPADRFSTAVQFAEALSEGAVAAAPVPHRRQYAGRNTALAIAGTIVLALVVWAVTKTLGDGQVGPAGNIESLAVLPLENLMGDTAQQYFVDGMTEALISDLAKVRALTVISRTSIMRYKGVERPLPEIAGELGVDAVIEGSVLRAGGRVRISVQLIDGVTDRHMWAENYERDLTDILVLQSEVAKAVAREIQVALTPLDNARLSVARSVDPRVYEAYLRGRQYLERFNPRAYELALEYFHQAIGRDSTFAPAYVGLAESYVSAMVLWGFPREELAPLARVAAARALALDSTAGSAHAAIALVKGAGEWDWAGGRAEIEHAVQLSPNDPDVLHWYAHVMLSLGRVDESIAATRRALALDPLSPLLNVHLAGDYSNARQYDSAVARSKKAIEIDPSFAAAYGGLASTYESMGMYDEAMAMRFESMARGGASQAAIAELRELYDREGMDGVRRRRLETRKTPYDKAVVAAVMGERDLAISLLERAVAEHDGGLVSIKAQHAFDDLRSDPRFRAILRRMNFPR